MTYRSMVRVLLLTSVVSALYGKAEAADKVSGFQQDFEVCSVPVTPAEERQLRKQQREYEHRIEALRLKQKASESIDASQQLLADTQLRQTQRDLLHVLERLE